MINMIKKLVSVSIILAALPLVAAQEKLTLTGSSTIAPLASEMAKLFEKKNPTIRVDVQSGGSSRGISDARKGLADIGMVSRSLNPDETDLKPFTIAFDGISIILNSKNKVTALTNEQIVAIYKGEIKNWKEVGGKDAAITVINKDEGRSTLELFLNYFKLKNSEVKASVVIGENEQAVKTVAGNPNAIGYVSIGTAEYDAAQGVSIKLIPLNGVASNISNVKNGQFPLSRPLNLVVHGDVSNLQKKFIEFAQSSEVTELIKREYFVPLTK